MPTPAPPPNYHQIAEQIASRIWGIPGVSMTTAALGSLIKLLETDVKQLVEQHSPRDDIHDDDQDESDIPY